MATITMRCVTINQVVYLRCADVFTLLQDLAAAEPEDVRTGIKIEQLIQRVKDGILKEVI
jgi:hypothetical protein